jgi:chaperonin GroES
MSINFKRILPLLNRVVIRKVDPEAKTKSGIILTKPDGLNYGVVLGVGPGTYDSNGKIIPLSVKIGDKVLLPEFGGSKVELGE